MPLDLVGVLGKAELKHSLRTADYEDAKVARNRAEAEADALFRRA